MRLCRMFTRYSDHFEHAGAKLADDPVPARYADCFRPRENTTSLVEGRQGPPAPRGSPRHLPSLDGPFPPPCRSLVGEGLASGSAALSAVGPPPHLLGHVRRS